MGSGTASVRGGRRHCPARDACPDGRRDQYEDGGTAVKKRVASFIAALFMLTGIPAFTAGEAVTGAVSGVGTAPDEDMRGTEKDEAEDRTLGADIVVVGAGGAGMAAAIAAADAGRSVIVLESQPAAGGNSVRSIGGMNAAGTKWQDANAFAESAGVEKTLEAADAFADNEAILLLAADVREQWEAWQADPKGYFDSTALFALDTLIGGGGLNDPELVSTLASGSAPALEWLGGVGIELTDVAAFGGASVKRIHRPPNEEGRAVPVGAYMVPLLEKALGQRENITLITDTTAVKILTDESGAARGVEAVGKNGASVTVNAGAVILATGGFGANPEMVAEYAPQLAGFRTAGAAGAQGQGILMAAETGADTVDMDRIRIHPTVQFDTGEPIAEGLRGDGAILINADGVRFTDETGTRDAVSAAQIAQPGSFSWLVIDGKMAEASSVIRGYIARGLTARGDTWEELAAEMGVPAGAFTASMNRWNGFAAERYDPDFGRAGFAAPLDAPPYYAVKVTAGILHTMGGLRIDSKTHVLDREGRIIPGLFAAGEVTGGVHGADCLGGSAVTDFVVFGRIAGEQAAEYLAENTAEHP